MTLSDETKKIRASRFSVAAALILTALKVGSGFLFQSLGMISAGLDSLMDLIASTVNFLSMRRSVRPADPEHPYGHGKIENMASLFQALILGLMGLLLVGEGVRRLIRPDGALPRIDAGIAVMIFSAAASYGVGKRLTTVGRETDSPLLKADAYHFSMDTWTNVGVVAALILARWQGTMVFDRIIAVLIGLWVIVSAYRVFRSSLDALLDTYLPRDMQDQIHRIIVSHAPEIMSYHKMRTRRAGSQKLIDLHLVTCKERSLTEAHRIADHIEKEIEAKIQSSDVIIHIEPCTLPCPATPQDCKYLKDKGPLAL